MNQYHSGGILALLAACGFGLMPIFALAVYQEGVSVVTLLFLRFFLAALAMFAYLGLRGSFPRVDRRQLSFLFLLGGLIYSAQAWLYFSAVKYIPASLAVLILYACPIFVALFARIFDKVRLEGKVIAAILLSAAGLTLALGASPAGVDATGVGFAFGAAVLYAAYLAASGRAIREISPVVAFAFIALFAAAAFLLAGLAGGGLDLVLTARAWGSVIGVSLFSTLMAMVFLLKSIELIGSTKASVLCMIEPIVTIAFSALLFAERLSPAQLIGGAAVLSGALLVILARQKVSAAE